MGGLFVLKRLNIAYVRRKNMVGPLGWIVSLMDNRVKLLEEKVDWLMDKVSKYEVERMEEAKKEKQAAILKEV